MLWCYNNQITTLDISYTPNLFNAVLNDTVFNFEYRYGDYILVVGNTVILFTVPSIYLLLPADLTTIEDEAFLNIGTDAVIIPPAVTSIGTNAFPAGTRIYGLPRSAARTWAAKNKCLFFPCTQEWLDSLQ